MFNIPISQSYWYDHHGKTLDKYKFNQFCFHYNGMRYLKKNGSWAAAKSTRYDSGEAESKFEIIGSGTNPIEEIVNDNELKAYLRQHLNEFVEFEKKIQANKS